MEICPACQEDQHTECVRKGPVVFEERRGALLDYSVRATPVNCSCQAGECAHRHLATLPRDAPTVTRRPLLETEENIPQRLQGLRRRFRQGSQS